MNKARPSLGFATFLAVVLLSVAAIGAMGLVLLFRVDAERTQRAVVGAQLRQVLLVAVPEIERRFASDPGWAASAGDTGRAIDIALPSPLVGEGFALSLTVTEADERNVRLRATASSESDFAEQALEYAWDGERWLVTRLALVRSP